MKIKYTLFLLIVLSTYTKAQTYVTIPDANFVTYLQTKFPLCMNGNQMNITCAGIQNATIVDVGNLAISDLTGIEYFTSLKSLGCDGNQLTSLPALPSSLLILSCGHNQIPSLPTLPNLLENLNCSNNQLTSLPSLPASLTTLTCEWNQITNLPNLPASLIFLGCGNTNISSLPTLPNSLEIIYCNSNQMTSLPSLPSSLLKLSCTGNQITSLPTLPYSLEIIYCGSNQITSLPTLPTSLLELHCSANQISSFPTLPDSLKQLECGSNQITSLPVLPNSLEQLYCHSNQITSLPVLPASLLKLWCFINQITSLPTLPDSIEIVLCDSNNISCFPLFPNSITSLNIAGNSFTCLPNYIPAMNSITLAYPLCLDQNILSNPNGCSGAIGISGTVYNDNNNNCLMDAGEQSISNAHIMLYDENNNLLAQKYSLDGTYNFSFSDSAGTYTVKLDTIGMPYTIQCASPGIDSTVILTVANPNANVNFNVHCNQIMDLGTLAVIPRGRIFPGLNHRLYILAGDMNKWFHLGCSIVVEGKIQVTITGPATFNSVVAGALTPTVSGNVLTYNISDFSTIDMLSAFRLWLTTDTTAQAGDNICVSVVISGAPKSFNQNNNNFQFCYKVGNSFDPNMKEVYPVDIEPGYQDWLTYSIHFQNTGNAPAMNIRLVDTLDTNLNLETFQVINYSHVNRVSLHDNRLIVYYPNIQLPDSTSDPEGSQGFVQYRIKPKAGLPLGTQIKNTANIYFDYNSAIVTNTTVNEFKAGGMTTISEKKENTIFTVYPNPGTGKYFVKLLEGTIITTGTIEVYNLLGETVLNSKVQSNITPIDLSQQPNGVYILILKTENGVFCQKLIINK